MNVVLEASRGTIELATALRTAPRRLREVMRTEAAWLGEQLVQTARETYRNAPQTTATATRVRSGMLRRSYTATPPAETDRGVTFDFGVMRAGAHGKALEYAAIHEFGGTIHAKPGRMLAIPIGEWSNRSMGVFRARTAMTATGVSRGSPSDYPAGQLFRIKNALFRAVSRDEIMPMFALVPHVTIPARPALMPSAAMVLPTWMERYAAALDRASTEAQ